MGQTKNNPLTKSTRTVLILFFFLVGLILLLILLYKKLNKEANGKYAIRRIVYREGGVRDRVRGAVLALESRLGTQLWPRGDTDEDGEEMQDMRDEERQVEDGGSQGSDTEGDEEEEEEEEEDNVALCGKTQGNEGDTSGDDSSSETGEQATDEPEEKEETQETREEKQEEKQEKVGEEQGKLQASGGTGLLIDLKGFSGSAIWSGEEGGDCGVSVVTPL